MSSSLIVSSDVSALHAYAELVRADFLAVDIFYLEPKEGEKTIQVKETIEFMEKAHLSPVGDGKLMVVCDFATVTPQAQNKMLKTIEDAPGRTTFLLLTTNIEPVLNTIRSRCVTVFLPQSSGDGNILPADICERLEKVFGVKIDEKALNPKQKQDILDTLSKINRNVAANCNPQNQQDLLILEILRNAKNS